MAKKKPTTASRPEPERLKIIDVWIEASKKLLAMKKNAVIWPKQEPTKRKK